MWSAWPWVIRMWVGSTSSAVTGEIGLLGFRNGSTSDAGVPLGELEARVAKESDVHQVQSSSFDWSV